jgi:myxalamid-type polyketide synthase MxaE and MxaD
VERCVRCLDEATGETLRRRIAGMPAGDSGTVQASQAIHAFALRYASRELWFSWGVRPAEVCGIGNGLLAAACTAGVLTLDSALRLCAIDGEKEAEDALAQMALRAPEVPLIVTRGAADTRFEAALLERLRGLGAREGALDDGAIWLEVGPRGATPFRGALPHSSPLPGIDGGGNEWRALLGALGRLFVAGVGADWARFDAPFARRRIGAPTYPFERERYWFSHRRGEASAGAPVASEKTDPNAARREPGDSSPLSPGEADAHAFPGRAPSPRHPDGSARPYHLLCLSATDDRALEQLAAHYVQQLSSGAATPAAELCRTAALVRTHSRQRLAVVGRDANALRESLVAWRAGKPAAAVVRDQASQQPPKIAMLFTGQGAQYIGMARQLYESNAVFREVMDACDASLRDHLELPLLRVLYPAAGEASPLDQTAFTQPALFAVEYGLARMLMSWGVVPALVLGHSIGEYVAACVAGVWSFEEGLRLAARRGALMQALPRDGGMVAVESDEAGVAEAIAAHAHDVSIAAVNAPSSIVLSGRRAALSKIVEDLQARGVDCRALNVSHAFHSPCMEPMLEQFAAAVGALELSPPGIPIVSNLTGALAGGEIATSGYWVEHVRGTVRFADAIRAARAAGCDTFIEVGPAPVLVGMGKASVDAPDVRWLPCLRKGEDDWHRLLHSLAGLYARGGVVDWEAFYACTGARDARLPGDRLEHERLGKVPGVPQRASGPLHREGSVVGDYYDELTHTFKGFEGVSRQQQGDTGPILNFAPLPEPVEGFSWVRTLVSPQKYARHFEMVQRAQRQTREVLFRNVDLQQCGRVLDFGCGYGSDVLTLGRRFPHLQLTGYTLSERQAEIGNRAADREGLRGRVSIHVRDSVADEFPAHNDLVFGFEVACHIQNKDALFDNIARNLRAGGHLLLADFISRAGFEIAHAETSSYLAPTDKWVDLFSSRGMELVDCVDISPQIANFFTGPEIDADLAREEGVTSYENVAKAFHSYTRLGRLLSEGMASYALFSVRAGSALSGAELERHNRQVLAHPKTYDDAYPDRWLYELEWRQAETAAALPASASGGGARGWLILADATGVGERLAERFKACNVRCAVATRSDEFAKEAAGRWRLRSGRDEDWRRLLEEVGDELGAIEGVAHLWSLDGPPDRGDSLPDLAAASTRGPESVLGLVRALCGTPRAVPPRCWFVTRGAMPVGGEARLDVGQAPLWGLAKVLAAEHPQYWGGLIDLDPASEGPVDDLHAQLTAQPQEDQIAFRGARRLVARLVRCTRADGPLPALAAQASYLVTGGTGALGMRAARWLIDQGARHVVLLSRRAEPQGEVADAIAALEGRGARVTLSRGDVASLEDMRRVFAQFGERLPPLRGIVHAAGVAHAQSIESISVEDYRRLSAAKIDGTWVLYQLAGAFALDFFVCYSSIAAVWGPKGTGHYAAANAFLDAFAHRARAEGLNARSVNWGPWAGGGMADKAALDELARSGVLDLHPRQAVDLLGRLLSASAVQTVVARMNWPGFKSAFENRGCRMLLSTIEVGRGPQAQVPDPAGGSLRQRVLSAGGSERTDLLRRYLVGKASRILGFDEYTDLDADATLLELGFDSLMAVQLRNAIRTDIGVDIQVGQIFESAGFAELVARIEGELERFAASGAATPQLVERRRGVAEREEGVI